METQTKSLFAKAHEAFWDAKAEKFIDKKKIIKRIKKIYKNNKAEIIEELGQNDPSYVNDISADFYYSNGIY